MSTLAEPQVVIPANRVDARALLQNALVHLVLLTAVAAALYPVMWVVSLSLSPTGTPEPKVLPIPSEVSLDNFRAVLFRVSDEGTWLFGLQLFNSIVISAATSIAAIIIATPAAYALSRFEFVGGKAAIRGMLATQMFPGVAAAIPLYLIMDKLGLIDARTGLILVYATSTVPFAIFQLRGAFDGIPRDLEEAAMVDGATRFEAFVRVVLPAARPALAVTGLFAFMTAWNEFILAATFMSREEMFTMPVVLQRYIGEYDARWGLFAAGAIVVSVPVMALFYVLQKHLVGGLAGAVKG